MSGHFGSILRAWSMRTAVLAIAALVLAQVHAVTGTTPAQAETRFVFANESNYDTMDPHVAFDVGRVAVRLNLYDGLMRWQNNPAELKPWVAERFEVSDDALVYTFHLRQGVKFHDGSEVTAQDVVYSLERILALGKGAASLFKGMVKPDAARAVDDYTVEFTLQKPSAIFLAVIPEIHIVNEDLVRANEVDGDWGAAWVSTNDAGSGAYQLSQFDPSIGFVGTRFPDHFMGWGDKWIDAIEFRGVADTNTRVLGLIRGDFQGIGGYLQSDQIKRINESGKAKVLEEESMRVMMFQINTTRPPFDDVHVRRAINYAFDYDGFNVDILEGLVERNRGPIPNTMWGAPKDLKGYDYDLDKAKEELAQASEKIDRPIEIAYLTGCRTVCNILESSPAWSAFPGPSSSSASPNPKRRPTSRHIGSPPIMPIRTTGSERCSTPITAAPSRMPAITRTRRWTRCSTRRSPPPIRRRGLSTTARPRRSWSRMHPASGSTTPSGTDPMPAIWKASCSAPSATLRRCGLPTTPTDTTAWTDNTWGAAPARPPRQIP
jgi:peptide/nickel transport system substrate-binding protein